MRQLLPICAALLLASPLVNSAVPITENVEATTKVTTIQIPISLSNAAKVVELKPQMTASDMSKKPKMMNLMESTHDPCDLECTKFDLNPICASNGQCLHEFPNECVMSTFNCRHPNMSFTITKTEPCNEEQQQQQQSQQQQQPSHPHHHLSWLKRCTPQDLMGFIRIEKV